MTPDTLIARLRAHACICPESAEIIDAAIRQMQALMSANATLDDMSGDGEWIDAGEVTM